MSGSIFAYIAAGVAGLGLLGWRFEGQKNTVFGSARWATVWEIFRRGHFRKRGLRVGDLEGQLGVFYDGIHAITFGQTGSGKGVSAILPNLLSYPYCFVIDPGGENTAIAVKTWRQQKLPFACINVFGMHDEAPWELPAHGFNPLDFLDPRSAAFVADALVFAEMLTPRTGGESGSSQYFKDAAQSAKRAMIVHIKTAEPQARQNIATLYEYVNSDAREWQRLLAAMKASPVAGGLVRQEAIKLERIEGQAPEEFSAILSTIQQDLSFLADPLVREKLSASDADFSILKGHGANQRGGIISVILPLQYMETHAAIPRLALACAALEMQRKPLAKGKVVFLIDEAATLGHVLRFPNWLATLRKYRVRIWSIWQNIGQLEALYGKGWQTIISNCGLLQILSVGDSQTAEHTVKLLGQCTIETVTRNRGGGRSVSNAGRPLLMADELRVLEEDQQIVFIGNLHPMVLLKTAYWKLPGLSGRFHPNPYGDGTTSGPGFLDLMNALWGKILYAFVWLMAPAPTAAVLITLAIAWFIFSLFR